jgi:hypothetical protein
MRLIVVRSPKLATEIGAVAVLCKRQHWLIAPCGAQARPPSREPPHPPAWMRLNGAKLARDLKVGGIFLAGFGKEQVIS